LAVNADISTKGSIIGPAVHKILAGCGQTEPRIIIIEVFTRIGGVLIKRSTAILGCLAPVLSGLSALGDFLI
jgi:hypothetical protein